MRNEEKYWFPAKIYGWGWGLPAMWQGWVVFLLFLGGFAVLAAFFPPVSHTTVFVIGSLVLILALVIVCILKGEPPKWHWGRKHGSIDDLSGRYKDKGLLEELASEREKEKSRDDVR